MIPFNNQSRPMDCDDPSAGVYLNVARLEQIKNGKNENKKST